MYVISYALSLPFLFPFIFSFGTVLMEILLQMRLANPGVEWQYGAYILTGQCDMDVVISWRKGADRSILGR